MARPESPKRRTRAEKPDEEPKAAIEKARAETEAALTRGNEEEAARLKSEEAMAEAQRALAAAQVKSEEESLARAKAEQAMAEAERALTEARKAIRLPTGNMKTPPRAPLEEGEQRISFIVRLTVDERGQPRRTEVEHAQSGKKTSFPALDVRRLAGFMRTCISLPVISEPPTPPVPSPVAKETPTPPPLRLTTRLTVSDVRVLRMGAFGTATLVLNPGEAFAVHVRFRLQGPDAASLTAQGSSFEIKVSASEVTTGTSTLLITHTEDSVQDVLEYTPQKLVSGLPQGLYRLLTLVTLEAPTKIVGHCEGPIVQVVAIQPPVNPASPLEVPLPQ